MKTLNRSYLPALQPSDITEEVVWRACMSDPGQMQFVPSKYRTPELILALVLKNGLTLGCLHPSERSPALIALGLTQNPKAADYIPLEELTPNIKLHFNLEF